MNRSQIITMQRRIGTVPDGVWGVKSIAACQRHLRGLMPSPNPWPGSSQSALRRFYGAPGDEGNLYPLNVAALDIRYEGRKVKTIRCHRLVAQSLGRVLAKLATVAPDVLRSYAGCFNFRPVRGGSSYSLHAWGAAIDLDPDHNGDKTHWPTRASMPIEVMEAFAREGWLPAGAFWHRDAMHFQATR